MNMKLGKILYIVVIVILLIVFSVSAIYVCRYFVKSSQQKNEYDDLAAIVESIQNNGDGTGDETTPDGAINKPILREYRSLYEMNPDLVGWIKIEDTRVNYPVMQSPDRVDYYLDHNFNKNYNEYGCIYVRETCDVNTPSDNVTIYGHNMYDNSMFGDLDEYLSKEFWEEHDTITFDTLTEHHTYKIFAVFKTTASVGEGFAYHSFENAAGAADFNEFIAECKELAFYETGITPQYGDKIICLSTCEYTLVNGRLVVAAVRVD